MELKNIKKKLNYKSCLTNMLILLVSTIIMLILGEELLRWLDGYPLFNLRLN